MIAARYVQQPYDFRKRVLDYDDWLPAGATLSAVVAEVTPATDTPFTVPTIVIDSGGRKIAYWAGNGESGNTYTVSFKATTSDAQRREDEVEFEVEEDG